jgi:hypothetical protein
MSSARSSTGGSNHNRPYNRSARSENGLAQISFGGVAEEGEGVGIYVTQGDDRETGIYASFSLGRFDLGIGAGISSDKNFDLFGFAGSENHTRAGVVVEGAAVFGYSGDLVGSGTAYMGQILASGYEFGALGPKVSIMNGIESVTPVHPLDTLVNSLYNAVGDSFNSIIAPLADPTNFGDPTSLPATPSSNQSTPYEIGPR